MRPVEYDFYRFQTQLFAKLTANRIIRQVIKDRTYPNEWFTIPLQYSLNKAFVSSKEKTGLSSQVSANIIGDIDILRLSSYLSYIKLVLGMLRRSAPVVSYRSYCAINASVSMLLLQHLLSYMYTFYYKDGIVCYFAFGSRPL